MADPTKIQQVMQLLGPNAPGNGWNDVRVAADLDSGITVNAIALAWWSARSAMLADMVDTSESSSSRSLNQAWSNALAMMNHYQALVNQENPIVNTRTPLRSYPMRRV